MGRNPTFAAWETRANTEVCLSYKRCGGARERCQFKTIAGFASETSFSIAVGCNGLLNR